MKTRLSTCVPTLGPVDIHRVAVTLADLTSPATSWMAKSAAPLWGGAKMATWRVEKLDRIADTPFAFLLPYGHFCSHRGSRDECQQTLNLLQVAYGRCPYPISALDWR
ncbi:MAG: hypothetical protein H3C28_03565 [Sphingomonadales bacterium]|nr:hypothetical protein [Sphingomonadales bacterium]